jgi:anti-anti-sigma factor
MKIMTTQTRKNCPESYRISYKWEDLDLIIYLAGELGLKNLTVFDGDIRREISKRKLNSVTIDFSEVCYLDSAAALALVQIKKDTNKQNIQIRNHYSPENSFHIKAHPAGQNSLYLLVK